MNFKRWIALVIAAIVIVVSIGFRRFPLLQALIGANLQEEEARPEEWKELKKKSYRQGWLREYNCRARPAGSDPGYRGRIAV
ncbi:hypothetical protein [Sinobaca sp. H24]|uniref:hypothetical protein n=1 Tax=Sinobaca sp. H24 TaxID=2923376 RepID=UPI00207A92F2|nr:hypothetical protein [Sinobaca sp. H24]